MKKLLVALLFVVAFIVSVSASEGVGHWRLNESSSETPFQDYAGSVTDNGEVLNSEDLGFQVSGVDSGISGSSGDWGEGYGLDMTGKGMVNVSDSSDLDITDNTITLSAWVKPDELNNNGYWIRKSSSYSLGYFDGDSNIEFYAWDTSPGTVVEMDRSNIDIGSWNHVVAVYNGVAGKMYVNGTLVKTNTGVSGDIPSTNNNVGIGGNLDTIENNDNDQNLEGVLDEPRIFDEDLNDTQVSNLYSTNQIDVSGSGTNSAPSASFTASTTDLSVSTDASSSSDSDGSITSYEWDWTNDGNYEDTGQTASYTYASDGTYTVKLRVTDDDGATDTATKDITVSSSTSNTTTATKDGGQEQQDSIATDSTGGVLITVSEDRVLESLNLFDGEEGVSETIRVIDDGNGTEIYSNSKTFGDDLYTFEEEVVLKEGRTYKIVNTGGDRAYMDTGNAMPETDGSVTWDGELYGCADDGTSCTRSETSSFVGVFWEITTSDYISDSENTISLNHPKNTTVSENNIWINGTVNEPSNVTYEIDGNGTFISLGDNIESFNKKVTFSEGQHSVIVNSTDYSNSSDTDLISRDFTVSTEPSIKLISATQSGDKVDFKFNATDSSGIENASLRMNLTTWDNLRFKDLGNLKKSPNNPVISNSNNWVTTPEFIVLDDTINWFWNRNDNGWNIMRATSPLSDPDDVTRANNDNPVFTGSSGSAEWFAPINNCDSSENRSGLPCYAYFTDNHDKNIGLAKTDGDLNTWTEVEDVVISNPSYYATADVNYSSGTIHILYNSGVAGGDMYHATAPLENPADVTVDPDNPVATSEDFRELDLRKTGDEWTITWHQGEDESCSSACNPYDAMQMKTKNFDSFDINQTEILSESSAGWDSRDILGLKFVPKIVNNRLWFGYTGRDGSNGEAWEVGATYQDPLFKDIEKYSSVSNGTNTVTYDFSSYSKPLVLDWGVSAYNKDGLESDSSKKQVNIQQILPPNEDTTSPTSSDNWSESGFVDETEVSVELTATDDDSGVANISYRVNGGSYTTDAGSSTTVTINTQGNNTLEYYATDNAGNVESVNTEYVALDNTPSDARPTVSLNLNSTSVVVGDFVEASVTGSDDNQVDLVELDWTGDKVFEESVFGSSLNVSRQFNSAGLYDVTARVTDNAGQTSTDSVTLDVNNEFSGSEKGVLKECNSTNSSNSFCLVNRSGEELFQDGFTNDDNTTLTAEVDVLDGVTGVFEFFGFAESTGVHNELVESSKVNVTVQDSSTEEPSNSAPSATYSITPTDPTPGESISFDGSGSSDSDGTIQSYEWDFGDGSTGTGETVTHSYSSEGDYTVSLTVTDNDGATGSYTNTVPVQSETSDGGNDNDDNDGGGDGNDNGGSIGDGDNTTNAEASLDGSSVELLAPYSGAKYQSGDSFNISEGGSQTIVLSGREVTFEVVSISGKDVSLRVDGALESYNRGNIIPFGFTEAVNPYIAGVIDTQETQKVLFDLDGRVNLLSDPVGYFGYNYSLDGEGDVQVLVKNTEASDYQVIDTFNSSSSVSDTRVVSSSLGKGIYTAKLRLVTANGTAETREVGFYMGPIPTVQVLRPADGKVVTKPSRQDDVSVPLDFRFNNRINRSVNVSTYYDSVNTGERFDGNLEERRFVDKDDSGLFETYLRKVSDLAFSWTDLIELGPETELYQNSSVYIQGSGEFTGQVKLEDSEASDSFSASSVPVTVTVERFDLTSDSQPARDHFDRRDGDSKRTIVETNSTNVSVDGSNESRYYDSAMIIYSPNNNQELVTEDLASFSPTIVHDFAVNSTATVNRSLVLEKVNSSDSATIDLNPLRTEYSTEVDGSYFNGSWTEGTYEVYGETYYSNGSVIQRIDTGHSFSVVEDKRGLMEYVFGSVVDSVTTVYDFTVERARLIVALMVMVGWFAGMKTQGFEFIGKYGAAAWFVVFSYLNFIPGGIQAIALTGVVAVLVIKFLGGEVNL